MKLVQFRPQRGESPRPGLVHGAQVLDPARLLGVEPARFPPDPVTLLASPFAGPCRSLSANLPARGRTADSMLDLSSVALLAPVPRPGTFRDFYSFEEHVRRARARRGLEVPAAWYRAPVFYFSNPNTFIGPGAEVRSPRSTRQLDCELEVACVIGRPGVDIPPDRALEHVAGFTLLNDWSARDVQAAEMAIGLGPSKGKDFATSLGPWILTPDELEPLRSGNGYDVVLEWRRNDRTLATTNWNRIAWSFEEMIAHASRDVWLLAGDVLGSGTAGGGCILELGEEEAGGWLTPGDVISLHGGPLGTLENRIAGSDPAPTRPPGQA